MRLEAMNEMNETFNERYTDYHNATAKTIKIHAFYTTGYHKSLF